MKLSDAECRRLQARINEILLQDFPWAKGKLLASRQKLGATIEDSNQWIRFRNALDRVATVQTYVLLRKVPNPPLPVLETSDQIPPHYPRPRDDNPDDILDFARYLFRNTAVEAWVAAAEFAIKSLATKLQSSEYMGDTFRGYQHHRAALEEYQTAGRLARSNSTGEAITNYEKAVDEAGNGIRLLRQATKHEQLGWWLGWSNAVVGFGALVVTILGAYYGNSVVWMAGIAVGAFSLMPLGVYFVLRRWRKWRSDS